MSKNASLVQGLRDPNNYHEFCRLLARLKSNYQLGELVMFESYPETIQLITKFTVESLQVGRKLRVRALRFERENFL